MEPAEKSIQTRRKVEMPLHPDQNSRSGEHPVLPVDEWDFRFLTEAELLTATLVEYTRSSHSGVAAIKEWQAKPLNAMALDKGGAENVNDTLRGLVHQPPTIADAIELLFGNGTKLSDLEVKNGLLRNLRSEAAATLGPQIDCEVAVRFTDLDLPWYALKTKYGADNLKTRFVPNAQSRRCVKGGLGPRSAYQHYLADPQIKVEKLLIDWSAPIRDIQRSFELWARERKIETAPFSRKVQNTRVRWDQLKFLAAYRLHKHDKDFDRFESTVTNRVNVTRRKEDWPTVMPLYKTHKGWLGAVNNARNLLAGCYPKAIRQFFGFPIFEFDA